MTEQSGKVVAYWDFYNSQTKVILEKGCMIDGNPEPVVGEEVAGIGDWEQSEVVEFQFKAVEGNIPQYDVYVKQLV
ncbi:hypothetical protein ACFLXT_02835 [Chloroflexota bacterium]